MKSSFLYKILFSLILSFQTPFIFSQPLDLKDVLDSISTKDSEIKDIQFTFIQEVRMKISEQKEKIRGELKFKKPDLFHIRYFSPQKQNIFSDGKKVWIHNIEAEQVMESEWGAWQKEFGFTQSPIPFSQPMDRLKERFDISLATQTEKTVNLILTPKEKGNYPYTLSLWFDRSTYLPQKSILTTDNLIISTQLKSIHINSQMSDSLFKPNFPKNVRIVNTSFPSKR